MAEPLPAISVQQSALDFPLLSFYSIIFYCVSFLCFLSLLYLNPMEHVCAFIFLLFQSIAADCVLFPQNKSFFTLQGALIMRYRLFLSITAAGVLGSTAFAGTMGSIIYPTPMSFRFSQILNTSFPPALSYRRSQICQAGIYY